ncbi:probable ran GTPase activating protein 1 [Ustilago trichophora]|uniref:Probable ran GTPase activating protein 1 n=1 Tax=Ustilago trichophora TaxID=86804 RepID=A0A5C3EFI0_9BASI|nr:probable ran GTPase activating protein 1 [Ustilago trichophora]
MSDQSKVFSLVGQGLKLDTKADIQPHLDKLEQITDLEEIHLGGNTLGVEACQALADILKNKTTLKVADFADIFTGRLITEIPDALRALCDALTDHTSLVELNLSDNAFGGRSAEPMVNFLKNNHSFSVLKLNNNGLGITGGTIVAQALFEAAQNLKAKGLESKLRTVICGRNRLENGSAPVWAKAYAAHAGLVEVRMFQNGIRMEGIEAITNGLASCPNLEVLDLQDNTATLRGSRAIAACLPKWPKLKTLNLSDCLLKPKGGALVFGALANGTNKALETIQVQYCDLDRKVLDQLASAIELHLTNLTKLDINGNWADEEDECIENIKSALAKHGHDDALLELDEMDPDGEESEAEDEEQDEDQDADEQQESEPAATETKPDETDELAAALAKTSVVDEK